jgi:NAD(P)H-hydrate repair Nnr-like enzyme with NAD(P)H-hydrate dehydratase domain
LLVGDVPVVINRGTPALLAAAVTLAAAMDEPAPYACLVGDTGTGKGSLKLYEYLARTLPDMDYGAITFHYLQPIVRWHQPLLDAFDAMATRPCLIADAGFMYMAKMSGEAGQYDLFTPDVGELAFLADEEAPHPFYTRGFILHEENQVPDLIARAYKHGNAARYLLVKGKSDYLVDESGILESVDSPIVDALEAIGGTGDTLTGLVSVLINSGMEIGRAALVAMRINRLAGFYADPTPATQIRDIVAQIPRAYLEVTGSV